MEISSPKKKVQGRGKINYAGKNRNNKELVERTIMWYIY